MTADWPAEVVRRTAGRGQLCLVLKSFFAATWAHLALVFPIERRFDITQGGAVLVG